MLAFVDACFAAPALLSHDPASKHEARWPREARDLDSVTLAGAGATDHLLEVTPPPALGMGSSDRRLAFEAVYRDGRWMRGADGAGCHSGWSSLADGQGTAALDGLLRVIARFGIRSVTDVPCGDGCFTGAALAALRNSSAPRRAPLPAESGSGPSWVGVDIVPSLVVENARRFGDGRTRFVAADVAAEGGPPLPRAELVFSRQMTQHLCNADAARFLRAAAAAPGARYLLATTFRTAADFVNEDIECASAGYRAQDLTKPPFSLGPPMLWLPERYPLDARVGLGLWPVGRLRRRLLR